MQGMQLLRPAQGRPNGQGRPSTIDSVSVVQHPSPFVMHLYDNRYIFTHRKPG